MLGMLRYSKFRTGRLRCSRSGNKNPNEIHTVHVVKVTITAFRTLGNKIFESNRFLEASTDL